MGTTNSHKATIKAGQPDRADWSLLPRGPVSGTVQGALALAALAIGGELAEAIMGNPAAIHPGWAAAATIAGVVSTVLTANHRNLEPGALLYRLGCWIGAGAWWTFTLLDTVWSQAAWGALAIGALAAGVLSPLGKPTPNKRLRSATTPPNHSLFSRKASLIGTDWEARIQRVCRIRVQVTNIVPWPTRAGYDVHALLPGAGVTRRQLADYCEALATDARLPEGCGVEVVGLDGADRGMVVLRVSTVNRMAQPITYPAEFTPQSILGDQRWGEYTNSDPVDVHVRQESVLVVGKKGSGKTTFLETASIELGLCIDNITWHLDLGGGITQPWIDVWLDGKVDRCPIDWAATDRDEAVLMLTVALDIAKHRKTAYRKLKRQQNTNLLPVSAALPQITIVIDEGAEGFKDRQVAELVEAVQNVGREPALNLIVSALRPTSDLVPTNMKKQSGVRILMHGPDDDEIGHTFAKWGQGLSMDALAGPGTAFISIGGSRPRPWRVLDNNPALIEAAAIAIARIRPDLDEASAEVAGYWYATRFERMRATFAALADDYDDEDQDPGAVAVRRAPTTFAPTPHPAHPAPIPAPMPHPSAAAARPHLEMVRGGAAQWPDLLAPSAAPPLRPTSTGAAADWPDLLPPPAWRPVPAPGGVVHPAKIGFNPTDPTAQPVPELLRRVLEVFTHARRPKVHSETIATELGMTTTELAALLRPLRITPLTRAFTVRGQEARGYHLPDITAAVEAIQRGQLEVPPEVAEWSAA